MRGGTDNYEKEKKSDFQSDPILRPIAQFSTYLFRYSSSLCSQLQASTSVCPYSTYSISYGRTTKKNVLFQFLVGREFLDLLLSYSLCFLDIPLPYALTYKSVTSACPHSTYSISYGRTTKKFFFLRQEIDSFFASEGKRGVREELMNRGFFSGQTKYLQKKPISRS